MLPLCDASNKLFVSPRDCWKPWTHLGRAIGVRWPCAEWGSVVESPRPPRCAIGQSWLEPRLHMLSTTVLRCSTVLFLIFHFVVWISRMESVKIWRPPNRHSSSIGADANDTFRNSALPSCKVESWKSSLPASYSFIQLHLDFNFWKSGGILWSSFVTKFKSSCDSCDPVCRDHMNDHIDKKIPNMPNMSTSTAVTEKPLAVASRAWWNARNLHAKSLNKRHGETWRDMERHGETWRQICFKMWPGHAYMVHFV